MCVSNCEDERLFVLGFYCEKLFALRAAQGHSLRILAMFYKNPRVILRNDDLVCTRPHHS